MKAQSLHWRANTRASVECTRQVKGGTDLLPCQVLLWALVQVGVLLAIKKWVLFSSVDQSLRGDLHSCYRKLVCWADILVASSVEICKCQCKQSRCAADLLSNSATGLKDRPRSDYFEPVTLATANVAPWSRRCRATAPTHKCECTLTVVAFVTIRWWEMALEFALFCFFREHIQWS